ncbi:MAG: DNA-directed DNA polymerase II small subunit [Nanoarchaeota archaeon]
MDLVEKFLEEGYLLEPKLFGQIREEEVEEFLEDIKRKSETPLIITEDIYSSFIVSKNKKETYDEVQIENLKSKSLDSIKERQILKLEQEVFEVEVPEAKVSTSQELELEVKDSGSDDEETDKEVKINSVRVLYTYNEDPKKFTVEDFTSYFKSRYSVLRDILLARNELENVTSINKISSEKSQISIIGSILDKRITKNGNFMLNIEDQTGIARVIISKNSELFELADNLTYDEILGLKCVGNNEFLFANKVVFPDAYKSKKKGKGKEGYALFISDLHVGSNKFLEKELLKFVKWINERSDSVADKVKYIFIVGDLVDGIGVYPGQEDELLIRDIYEQYEECAYILSQIRKDIKLIVIPGNHDATRLSEPQPILDESLSKPLYRLKNLIMLSNPTFMNIVAEENFEGYDLLLYHGYSLDYYANNIKAMIGKAYKSPDILLKYLLQKRHLAPTHGSTAYVPLDRDPLVIGKVPDLFVSAHLHKTAINYYNGVSLVACSCWQAQTDFQKKMGHEPDPCKVPVLNLKDGKITLLDFSN